MTDRADMPSGDIHSALAAAIAGLGQSDRSPPEVKALLGALQSSGVGLWIHDVEDGETCYTEPLGGVPTSVLYSPESGSAERQFRYRICQENGEVRFYRGVGRIVEGTSRCRIAGVSIDETAEVAEKAQQILLLQEANHRFKNLAGIMTSMVSLLAPRHDDVACFANEIRDRFIALGRAHALAWSADATGWIGLEQLLDTIMEPYAGYAMFARRGPDIAIAARVVSTLSLILQEWATNSVKYGALGSPGQAKLDVNWSVADDQLTIRWTEAMPERVDRHPNSRGFGSDLLKACALNLSSRLDQKFLPEGASFALTMPAQNFSSDQPGAFFDRCA